VLSVITGALLTATVKASVAMAGMPATLAVTVPVHGVAAAPP
jgi:hypothetical protein